MMLGKCVKQAACITSSVDLTGTATAVNSLSTSYHTLIPRLGWCPPPVDYVVVCVVCLSGELRVAWRVVMGDALVSVGSSSAFGVVVPDI
jgi:hypothetical protein